MSLRYKFEQLPSKDLEEFNSLLRPLTSKKGTILIPEGKEATKMYLVVKGALRSWAFQDGNDYTDFFFFEDVLATDYASFYTGHSSKLTLECLEDCELMELRKDDLLHLYQKNHHFSEIGRLIAEYAFTLVEERMQLLHTKDLETKYNWMIDHYPQIFQRVPHYHIATFLGVKPQSLSRIRAKIAGKLY